MKKMLSFIVVLVIAFSMSTTAFAIGSEINSPEVSASVDINYKMAESYTVIIPSEINITNIQGNCVANAQIVASNMIIPFGKTLNVKLSSENYSDLYSVGWKLVDQSNIHGATNNTLSYIIETNIDGSNRILDEDIPALTFESGEIAEEDDLYTGNKTQRLSFTITDQITKAGNYADTLTFTVSVDDTVTTP